MTCESRLNNSDILAYLEALASLYGQRNTLSFSNAFRRSKFRLIPSFLDFMKRMEENNLIAKIKGVNDGEEVSWQVTDKGKGVLRKYEELRKELELHG